MSLFYASNKSLLIDNCLEEAPAVSNEERINALLKAPPDGWVAFSADESKVVAYGTTYDEVVTSAQSSGENEPILVKVPKDWTTAVMTT